MGRAWPDKGLGRNDTPPWALAVAQHDRPVLVLRGQLQLPPLLCAQTTHTNQLVPGLASRGSPCGLLTVLPTSLLPSGPPSPVRAYVHTPPYRWGGEAHYSHHSAAWFVTVATDKIMWVTRHILLPRLHPQTVSPGSGDWSRAPLRYRHSWML